MTSTFQSVDTLWLCVCVQLCRNVLLFAHALLPSLGYIWRKLNINRTVSVLQYHVQRTLDKDCRQAEEPKQLVDKASRFHLGRQCQHSAVICSGALLFSSRVLRPSLVTLCSHGVEDPTEWLSPTVTTIKPNDSTKIGYVLCVDMRCENQADTRRHDSRPKRVKKTF